MDYSILLQPKKISRVGIVGATKGFGMTLLAQIPTVTGMKLRAISSRHVEDCLDVLRSTGYPAEKVRVCETEEDLREAAEDDILVLPDSYLMLKSDITSLVQCTGNSEVDSSMAEQALQKGMNVYMVSKETDSICGTYLSQLAEEKGCVYSLVNGDQPRNLLDLVSWAQVLGLEIICAGKSSEYDFVYDRNSGMCTYLDGSHEAESMPEMGELWHLEGPETLKQRAQLLSAYLAPNSADLCEMNLVSNVTGFPPAADGLHYPVCKINELADVFIPVADGGILEKTGVVDVFYNLRETEEASFCGGEFIVVRCVNPEMWDILEGKGHVVSRNKQYACIYWPYHLMGLETPISILLGDQMGIGLHTETRQHTLMVGRAKTDLTPGTEFWVEGHHHQIEGLTPNLVAYRQEEAYAPFYLLNGTKLVRPVPQGELVRMQDLELEESTAQRLFREGLKF